jgi:enoyl-[acyl-carrier protein] reductase I
MCARKVTTSPFESHPCSHTTTGAAVGVQRSAGVQLSGLPIDCKGKVAFVAGVADSSGYGWSIVKHLAAAGATVVVGTWPPVLGIFEKSLKSGKLDEDLILPDGTKMDPPKM